MTRSTGTFPLSSDAWWAFPGIQDKWLTAEGGEGRVCPWNNGSKGGLMSSALKEVYRLKFLLGIGFNKPVETNELQATTSGQCSLFSCFLFSFNVKGMQPRNRWGHPQSAACSCTPTRLRVSELKCESYSEGRTRKSNKKKKWSLRTKRELKRKGINEKCNADKVSKKISHSPGRATSVSS